MTNTPFSGEDGVLILVRTGLHLNKTTNEKQKLR